jgi:hypothetical protein
MTFMADYKDPYPNAAAIRRRYALQLLQDASRNTPVQHLLQALARAIQGGLGGYYARQLEREEFEKSNAGSDSYAAAAPAEWDRPTVSARADSQFTPQPLPSSQMSWARVLPTPGFSSSENEPSISTDDWFDEQTDGPRVIPTAGPKHLLQPHPEAGAEHSTYETPKPGEPIKKYETYERNPRTGGFDRSKRYRGQGGEHGRVPPPFILERRPGKGPGSTPVKPRPARPEEIPGPPRGAVGSGRGGGGGGGLGPKLPPGFRFWNPFPFY